MKISVGNQLNVVETDYASFIAVQRAVARATDINNGRALFAKRFPDGATPTGFKSAIDVVCLVSRRRGRKPERVWRFDTKKFG